MVHQNIGVLPYNIADDVGHATTRIRAFPARFPEEKGIDRCQGGIEPIDIDHHITRQGFQAAAIFGTEIDPCFTFDTGQNRQTVGATDDGAGSVDQTGVILQQRTGTVPGSETDTHP
jgi:hypothetical protein